MTWRGLQFGLVVLACASALGQSGGDMPLGDVARNIRRAKVTTKAADVHVDNDNFSKIMENAETRRMQSMQYIPPALGLSLSPVTQGAAASPDVSCSLTFSAKGIRLLDSIGPAPSKDAQAGKAEVEKVSPGKAEPPRAEAAKPEDGQLPASELAKLEGPATVSGDSLQLSIYNGTTWQVQEITIGLTIVRRPSHPTLTMTGAVTMTRPVTMTGAVTRGAEAHVLPASAVQIVAKRSDTLVVYRLKGSALPNSRGTFTQPLGTKLGADQEWHWAILEAKGVEAKAPAKPN